MAEKKQHPIRNSIIASLSTAALVSLVVWLIPGGWNWIATQASAFWSWLIASVSVARWLLICLAIAAGVLVVSIGLLAFFAYRGGGKDLDYTEDVLFGIRWRWRYGHMGLYSICAFCPTCDLQMHQRLTVGDRGQDSIRYHCEHCRSDIQKFDGTGSEVESRIEREIQRRLRAKLKTT